MAKIYGLNGVLSGKQGGTVFAVRNGENIAKKYQPIVSNPSTKAQVAVRSRFKLLSQVSEVLSPIIGFRKVGVVSARNLFTKGNYDNTYYDNVTEKASFDFTNIDLTGSVLALSPITVTRGAGIVSAALSIGDPGLTSVMYGVLVVGVDGKLRLYDSRVVSDAGVDNTFPSGNFQLTSSLSGYMFAYGIRVNTETGKAIYGNIIAEETSIIINTLLRMRAEDYSLTETVIAVVERHQS